MIIFAELLEDGDRIECLLEVILVLGRHILQEAHDDLLAFCSQNLLHFLLLCGEDALVFCFVLVVFLVGVFPLIHAGFKTCLFGGLSLDLNLEQLDGQQRQRVVRHVLHQPIKNGTLRLEQQILAHPLFILAQQEANDLVEVAAEDWQHLFIIGLEEVLDQRIKQTCVPLRLRLLGGWLLIFSIRLLKLEFRLLGLLVLQIQLVNHSLLFLLLVLHLKSLLGLDTLTFVSLRLSLTSLLTSSASSWLFLSSPDSSSSLMMAPPSISEFEIIFEQVRISAAT